MKFPQALIESAAIVIILLFFVALQYNAISKGNYAAQDFWHHHDMIKASAETPWDALMPTTYTTLHGTPFTLYHYIGGRIYDLVGKSRAFEAIAIMNCIANMAALSLFYLLIRRIIGSLILRISCFLFITFLPLTVITSVVIATEAPMPLFFVSIIWVIILIVERLKQKKSCLGWMAVGCVLLVTACAIKFIYGLCLLGVLLIGIILGCGRILEWRSLASSFLMIVIIPTGICAVMYFTFIRYQAIPISSWQPMTYWAKHDASGRTQVVPEERMDFQSLFFLKSRDVHLLQAPYFHEGLLQDGKVIYPLLQTNYFSYPAMMHLAIFTDFLNIYQPIRLASNAPGVEDEYYTRIRPPENQDKMRLAVFSGLLFSLASLVALCWMGARMALWVWQRKLKFDDVPVLVLFILGLTLFCGVALGLPFTHFTYSTGVWLPRHIVPAIISMGILLFVVLDRQVAKRGWACWVIFWIVILQSILHFSFLWVTA